METQFARSNKLDQVQIHNKHIIKSTEKIRSQQVQYIGTNTQAHLPQKMYSVKRWKRTSARALFCLLLEGLKTQVGIKMAAVPLCHHDHMVGRLVMLRVGTTGAEPLRPIARYIRRRLLRPRRAGGGRVPCRAAGNDDRILQPAPPKGGTAIREPDRR